MDYKLILSYNSGIKIIWSKRKNRLLEKTRSVSFEDVAEIIQERRYIDIVNHPNLEKYPGQVFIFVKMYNYVHVVPAMFNQDATVCKLITIYRSRKYNAIYFGGGA